MKASIIIGASWLLLPATVVRSQAPNDAQIASIVVTANQVDIDAGKLALAKSRNAEVKAFAQRMITDHSAVIKAGGDLLAKLNVTPEDNPTSESLKSDGDKNLAHLKTLKDGAFDKAYMDREVEYHTQVIDALDKTLIPSTTNAEFKALLVKARPTFVAHLEEAKRLQTSLNKKN
jgi:Predicted outer membrane protein